MRDLGLYIKSLSDEKLERALEVLTHWSVCHDLTQSPPEALFLQHLVEDFDCSVAQSVPGGFKWKRVAKAPIVIPQYPIGNYRADFFLFTPDSERTVVVEIDGHKFHEKTPQQASSDRARERQFVKAGHTVVRYTGADILKDPVRCAREACEFATA